MNILTKYTVKYAHHHGILSQPFLLELSCGRENAREKSLTKQNWILGKKQTNKHQNPHHHKVFDGVHPSQNIRTADGQR